MAFTFMEEAQGVVHEEACKAARAPCRISCDGSNPGDLELGRSKNRALLTDAHMTDDLAVELEDSEVIELSVGGTEEERK